MKLKYHGLCAEFGKRNTILASVLLPAATNVIIHHDKDISLLILSTVIGAFSGGIGFSFGVAANEYADALLRSYNTEKKTGNNIVRGAQLAAYSVTTALFLHASVIADQHWTKSQDVHPQSVLLHQ